MLEKSTKVTEQVPGEKSLDERIVVPLDGSKLLLVARIPTMIYVELSRFGFLLLILAFAMTDFGYRMSDWALSGAGLIFGLVRFGG